MSYFYPLLLLIPHVLFADYSKEHSEYLITAVEYDNYEMAALSLANNADPNCKMRTGAHLTVAEKAYYINLEIMKLLFAYGADKNKVLPCAIRKGDVETCIYIVEKGGTLSTELLFYRELKQNVPVLEWLLKQGLDVNASRRIAGDYKQERLLFNALFELCLGYGPGQDTITFVPSYEMLEILKMHDVDTSLAALDDKNIFEVIDRAEDITPEQKAHVLEILNRKRTTMVKSAQSVL